MNTDRWKRLRALFAHASELDGGERAAYLDAECGDDAELRREIEELLAASTEETDDVDEIVRTAASKLTTAEEGRRIGPYRVVRVIGQGGMGQVYLAKRDDEELDLDVAIKVVGWFAVTDAQVERFLAERQILASLNHPYIARLLDGGRTEEGVPYLAMEYIEGSSITEYADAASLSLAERLELFLKVCDAVQHAHRQLVIHRDIKPSNILVTRDGTPKLLDFGIAKLLDTSLAVRSQPVTRADMRVLTPEYASPEQLRGLPVTIQTDVYGLGVLLYQLITGRFPYVIDATGSPRLEEIILETEPGLPSVAVTREVPDGEPAGPALPSRQLSRLLEGDLDNIAMMALRKEPERRYETVKDFADDVRNFLENRPVRARGDSALYIARKFARRNRTLLAVAAAVLLAVTLQTAFYTVRLAEERDRAELEAQRASEVSAFLTELFAEADPSRNLGEPLTARQMLDRGAVRVIDELGDEPELQAALMVTIAESYNSLEENVAAYEYLEASMPPMETALGPVHPDVLELRYLLGLATTYKGDAAAARPIHAENLRRRRGSGGPSYETVRELKQLAVIDARLGNYEAAEAQYDVVLEAFRKLGRDDDLAKALLDYGSMLRMLDREAEEEAMILEALAIQERSVGTGHPAYAAVINNLGNHYFRRGDYAAARRYMEQHVELQRALYGEDGVPYGVALINYASLLRQDGDIEDALRLYNEALVIAAKGYGRDAPRYAYLLENIANTLTDLGRYDEAEAAYAEALGILGARFGTDHPEYAFTQRNYGASLRRMGRPAEAIPELEAAIATWTEAHGPEYSRVVTTRLTLAESHYDAGQLDAAAAEADQALAIARKIFSDDYRQWAIATRLAGRIQRDRGRFDVADMLFEESVAAAAELGGGALGELTSTEIDYAKSLAAQGRRGDARRRLEARLDELGSADEDAVRQRTRIEAALAEI